jgi:hypothetical protein
MFSAFCISLDATRHATSPPAVVAKFVKIAYTKTDTVTEKPFSEIAGHRYYFSVVSIL